MRLLFALAIATALLSCKKDTGETPPPDPVTTIGAHYQGGIVFYLDENGQHGLVITDHDIDTCKWTNETGSVSTFMETIPLAYKNQYSANNYVGAGEPFTNKIVEVRGAGHYAAKSCYDLELNGYSDWFLPTHGEIFLVINSGVFNSSNADEEFYWTSYEGTSNMNGTNPSAQGVQLYSWGTTHSSSYNKNVLLNVRAVRKF